MANDLARTLIDDYESLGFGERVNDTTLRSLAGDAELELLADEYEARALAIFANGVHLTTVAYSDKKFNEELLAHVTSVLNI